MATHLKGVRRWTEAEIKADVKIGIEAFRARRLAESQEQLRTTREQVEIACRKTLPILHTITGPGVDKSQLAKVLADRETNLILRCIGTPPISADDLKTLTMGSVSPTSVRGDQEAADKIGEILSGIRDFKRFPWLQDNRPPTSEELDRAQLATVTLASASKILTQRRSDERVELEDQLHDLLRVSLTEIPAQPIINVRRDGPKPGEFMRNALVGEHGADAIVGLYDYRLLCIECKASNSEINSRKRLNKEVGADAKAWLSKFGDDNIVPAAAIRGVFKPEYVKQAQEVPVAIFWSHRLSDLLAFINSTKPKVV